MPVAIGGWVTAFAVVAETPRQTMRPVGRNYGGGRKEVEKRGERMASTRV